MVWRRRHRSCTLGFGIARAAACRELLRTLEDLARGEVVTVTRIDRLARSTFDLFAIVKSIVDTGGQFRSLGRRPTPAPVPGA